MFVLVVGGLLSSARGVHPLKQSQGSSNSLTFACIWWPVAVALTLSYFVYILRRYAGKLACSATINRSTNDCEHDQNGVQFDGPNVRVELNPVSSST